MTAPARSDISASGADATDPTDTLDSAADAAFLAAARRYWHPVARSTDLAPGSVMAVPLLAEDLALWRAPDGRLALTEDRCVHRGTRLSLGSVAPSGCLRCPYHGWEFDASGACIALPQLPDGPIPGRAGVRAHRVEEHDGLVWACLVDESRQARACPRVPGADRATRRYVGVPKDWACQSPRQIENFFDLAHFSVLHSDVFGNPEVTTVDPYEVRTSDDGWQLEVDYSYPARDPLEVLAGATATTVRPLELHYVVDLPFAVSLASEQSGQAGVLFAANQPCSATTSRVYWVQAFFDTDLDVPDVTLEAYQEAVMGADRPVVESQRPERLPLDLAAELQLPFDRLAVAYRRRLAELGFPEYLAVDAGP